MTINPAEALSSIGAGLAHAWQAFHISSGTVYSVTTLLMALTISVGFLILRRRPGRRRVRIKVLLRALFPGRWLTGPSTRTDLIFHIFNMSLFGLLFGWALLSIGTVVHGVNAGLESVFGPLQPTSLPKPVAMGIMTLLSFLAYEFGYWVDHYLKHSIPFLWEFHKVHHAAEVLSPATNARVHPVDTIIFMNILAITMGATGGVAYFMFGQKVGQFELLGSNAIICVFMYLLTHLHHTHMWIAFTGWWGKLIQSPAHHQIHHSMDPRHFNKNMGGSLALFDWLFGTLYIPSRRREVTKFGVEPGDMNPHSVIDSMIAPVRNAARLVLPANGKAAEPGEAHVMAAGKAVAGN